MKVTTTKSVSLRDLEAEVKKRYPKMNYGDWEYVAIAIISNSGEYFENDSYNNFRYQKDFDGFCRSLKWSKHKTETRIEIAKVLWQIAKELTEDGAIEVIVTESW